MAGSISGATGPDRPQAHRGKRSKAERSASLILYGNIYLITINSPYQLVLSGFLEIRVNIQTLELAAVIKGRLPQARRLRGTVAGL